MPHRARWFAALLLVACAPPDPPAARAPIVGGALEMGEPAVVTVQALGGIGLCTGTLITPRVVLTAKHCVQAPRDRDPYPPTAITVGVGWDARDLEEYRAREVITTPGAFDQDPRIGLSGALVGEDLGLVVLRQPIEGVTPIPIRRDEPTDLVGTQLTAIGFGRRPDGNAGLKYKTTGPLERIFDTVLYSSMTICSGDSGGPFIQETPERRVVGVASFGEANACPSRQDGYNGLFGHLDLIDAAIAIAGDCLEPREESCNSLDDDCDGAIDETCAALGEACAEDADCAFGSPGRFLPDVVASVCEDLGDGPVCTRPCDPTEAGACGAIAHLGGGETEIADGSCRSVGGCDGRCVVLPAGEAIDGTACEADGDCASRHCADPGDGRRRCLPACRGGAGTCPVGEACAAVGGECGFCVDAAVVVGGRGTGEPCDGDADCQDGACVEGACAGSCAGAAECPDGYRCDEGRCLRGELGEAGDPCADDEDCAASRCAADGYCTRACGDDAPCPDGTSCGALDGEPSCVADAPVLGQACDGACALGDVCEGGRCARPCGVEGTCPVGWACARDDEGRARCAQRGGCAVGLPWDARGRGAPLALLGLLALARGVRRRGRRASRSSSGPCP